LPVVGVIAYTPNPEYVIETGYLQCHSHFDDVNDKRMKKELHERVEEFMRTGHMSVTEHASITFSIRDISRSCSHQIVRHRIGVAISQMSMRYTRIGDAEEIVIPASIENAGLTDLYLKMVGLCHGTYQAMINEQKIPMEDARMVLPIGTKTEIVMTFDIRSLIHFLQLRLSKHAQWEIRKLANKMLKEVKKVAPTIFKNAGPGCKTKKICPENKKDCPLYPK